MLPLPLPAWGGGSSGTSSHIECQHVTSGRMSGNTVTIIYRSRPSPTTGRLGVGALPCGGVSSGQRRRDAGGYVWARKGALAGEVTGAVRPITFYDHAVSHATAVYGHYSHIDVVESYAATATSRLHLLTSFTNRDITSYHTPTQLPCFAIVTPHID